MQSLKTLSLAGAALAAGLLIGQSASAATYIAATDFNGAQGGSSGVFTYGKIVGGTFSLLTAAGGTSFGGGDDFNTPLIADLGSDLLMHPGEYGEVVALRFTAPTAGIYTATFTGYLSDHACGGCGDTDGVTLGLDTQSAVLTHADYSPVTLTKTFTLSGGDSFDFTVGPNSNFLYDTTITSAIVSSVPEPATWISMLLGFGLLGFALRARKGAAALA